MYAYKLTQDDIDARLDRDRFLVKQNHMAWGKSKYYVFDDAGNELFYVERPVARVLTPGNISIFEDDKGGDAVFTLRQDSRFGSLKRRFTLIDERDGSIVATFMRDNIKSWFRRHWQVADEHGAVIAHAREDSPAIAAIRRIVEWIPYASIIVAFVRTNFVLSRIDESGAEVPAGAFNRKLSIGDKYALDLSKDGARQFDRRAALALGILLDTGEAR